MTTTTATEAELVLAARNAISEANWTLGRCAAEWLEHYARGQTITDLAEILKTNAAWLEVYRRTWLIYGPIRMEYPKLRWAHFLTVDGWDDWKPALEWANQNEATIDEMTAWHRLQQPGDQPTPNP